LRECTHSALTLEYLEINLYETVVNTYSNQDFKDAGYTAADRDTFLQIIQQVSNNESQQTTAWSLPEAKPE